MLSALSRVGILRSVQTLVLDGLSVTSDVCHEILTRDEYAVRILSLRGCQHLNHRLLRGALEYACRPSRPDGAPRLKGLYIFGMAHDPMIPGLESRQRARAAGSAAVAAAAAGGEGRARSSSISAAARISAQWNRRSRRALADSGVGVADPAPDDPETSPDSAYKPDDPWWHQRGQMFPHPISAASASMLLACRGIIAFDAVLCSGPQHITSPAYGRVPLPAAPSARNPRPSPWETATHALDGCASCGSAPEGMTVWGDRRESDDGEEKGLYPLLAPPPLHSSNVRVAMCPTGQSSGPSLSRRPGSSDAEGPPSFVARCSSCLLGRYCVNCHKWWCETCYPVPLGAEPSTVSETTRLAEAKVRTDLCSGCEMDRSLERLRQRGETQRRALDV